MDISKLPDSKIIWGVFFVVLIAALLTNLGVISLQFEEPRRAIVALEMDMSGQYLIPKINGYNYYNKPPVYNWLLIICFKLFHSLDEWVVRILTVLSLLSITAINYFVVRKKINSQVAILSSLVFLTSSNILFYFSAQGEIDMVYTLIVFLQIICLLHYFEKKDYLKMFLISYFLTALGVLTKGIPSLAFQAITILALFIYHKRFKALFSIWNFAGIFLMSTIIGGYFYFYSLQEDPWPMITRLISESSNRAFVQKSWLESIEHLYLFPLLVLNIFLPWSLLMPLFKIKETWKQAANNYWFKMSALFLVTNILVYWLSPGARDRYLYMFLPFLSVMVVYMFTIRPHKLFSWVILLFEVIGLLGSFAIPFFSEELSITENVLIAAFLFSFSAGAIFLFKKYQGYRIFQFICFLLLTRVAFDFLVLPTRASHRVPYETLAETIQEHEVVGFTSPETYKEIYNPLIQQEVSVNLISHPRYAISFYYSRLTGKLLTYQPEEKSGKNYMVNEKDYLPSTKRTVLDTLVLEGGFSDYYIYKVEQ